MCRIAGIINFKAPHDCEMIDMMRDAMTHGGPDDFGIYRDAIFPLALGHRRLSLIDLSSSGHQPMTDNNNEVVIVFNGEIYNYLEIKSELKRLRNIDFKSKSDTEVIIYSYLEWGTDCFKKFNGMFALAVWDKRFNKLVLARDHAGMKPLYYSIDKDKVYFASEIRAFKKIRPNWPESPHWRQYLLLFGHLPEPITTLDGVVTLSKGTFLEISLPSLEVSTGKYFNPYYTHSIAIEQEATDELHKELANAVARHLISDAPIGLFLSGGLDSSILTLLARDIVPDTLRTLSIYFEDEKFSEKYYQDVIINKTGAAHDSYLVSGKEFEDSIPDIFAAMDQPSSDGINSYFICKYAKKKGLKAAISGIGADELLGGYKSFERTEKIKSFQGLPKFLFRSSDALPGDKFKRVYFLALKSGLGEYLFNRGFFVPREIARLLGCTEEEVVTLLSNLNNNEPRFIEKLDPLERISYLESNLYMQNQLLKDTDCMSMWHSIEVRIPFLDKRVMELIYSITSNIRFNKYRAKGLLINAFDGQLPSEIKSRQKQGFIFPFEQWMQKIDMSSYLQKDLLRKSFMDGQIHWSRYWAYVLSQKVA